MPRQGRHEILNFRASGTDSEFFARLHQRSTGFVKCLRAWAMVTLIVFTLGWIGCTRVSRAPLGISTPIALEALLLKPEVRERIREAERNLPEDVWKAGGESHPVIRNVSRSERE